MSKITAANLVNEPLTTQESKQLTLGPAISTVTFLRGDITAATATLKSRLAILLKANPYLAGTLVKINGALHVQFPKETSDDHVTRIFNQTTRGGKVGTLPIVDSTMDFFTLCKSIGGGTAEVVKGARKDEPLMALTVVADAKRNDTFAVVFSISHVIIDGFSYYKLFSQLCDGVASESYSATRKHDIVSEAKKAMGEKEAAFANSTAVICNVIGGMMCGKKPLIESYRIDADKVNTIKQQATNNTLGVDFVSTNDVLTSSFGNATNADFLLMPVNFRDRLSNFNALDAGNYEGALVFGKEDYQRPTQIRATLNAGPPTNPNYLRGGVRNPKPLPGCSGACCGQMTMLTNWCFPFWEELKLEGCEQLLHLPLIDVNLVPFDVSVVYKPGAGQAALMFMVRSLDSDGLINGLPLGDPILSPEQAFEFTCTLKHKTSSQGSGGNNEDSIGNSKE